MKTSLIACLVAVLAAGATAGAVPASSHSAPRSAAVVTSGLRLRAPLLGGGVLGNLRVCSYVAFVKGQGCSRDERSTVITSNTIACSVDVTIRPGAGLHLRLGYQGETVYERNRAVDPGSYTWWVRTRLFSNVAHPGGEWTCSFGTGSSQVEAHFQSGGPTGQIVDVEACAGRPAYVIGLDPLDAVCRADEGATALSAPSAIVCNAVFPTAAGRVARTQLLRRSAGAGGGLELIGSESEQITEAVWQVKGTFSKDGRVTTRLRTVSSTLPPGDYLCRFLLDGQVAADRDVHVTA